MSAGLGIRIYRYRGLIRRHWWVMALTIGLGLFYEGYVLFTKPRLFESNSELIIRDEMSTPDKQGATFDDRWGNIFGTYVTILKNPVTLEETKKQLALDAPNLTGNVEIVATNPPRTNIFTVSGKGENGEYTRRYVDTLVAKVLDFRRKGHESQVGEAKDKVDIELKKLKETKTQQEAEFQTFIKANNMAFWKEQATSSAVYLSNLKNQEAQLHNEAQRLENMTPDELLMAPPQSMAPQGLAPKAAPGSIATEQSAISSAPFNSELYNQYVQTMQALIQKKAEVESWKTVWKPKHPKMQALERQLADLQRLLDTIKKQNEEATAARLDAIKAELKSLATSIANWEKKVTEASGKDAEYNSLQNAIASTQGQIDKLSGTSAELGPTASPDTLVVMHYATPPEPVPPGTVKHLLIGLVGGFVLGMIILIVMDRSDDRLASSTEMLDHFSEPILGQIPNVADSRKETGLPLLQLEDERYTYAEAFRSLRSSLIFMPNQAELKTLLVTSAIPNEGKSTIASNLAITMSASGARVLLVDADLRRGDIAQLFDTDGRFGLSSILRGEVPWKEAVQTTKHPTLSLIPRGPVTNQSGELLLKPELMNLLEEFKDAYDLTIFNTAPILAADDTSTLAPNFDGALMVVRASFTSARLTKNSLNMLYQRQVNVLGLILNCIDSEMPDYYYYRYPKYYAAS
jgi:capsular exopolysaccharide synthesis family protein